MKTPKTGIETEIEITPPTENEVNDKFMNQKRGEKRGENSNENKIKTITKIQAKWEQQQKKNNSFQHPLTPSSSSSKKKKKL